ncbi:Hsp20/alpha crystallin family protein [Virgibacillus sp. AGTR]|uniref:Hsp20/alpha crystallin family protein n=1 Tax=Virgibacillus sp. AGTR TaxID=2812055 RepID=UPI001964EC2D|nr:Hsp20/alpha crystallin family protein [Virgibacillus sp. AGTR]MCC2250315.1 Hsp20/alpha crystallin family protein [Virgibacillus sp. AGTR]QRZ20143.1 Hsp20/alpha crystallin family protein [Virgibacillus sp. AGTR]
MDPFQQMTDWKKNMDHFFGENFWNEFEGIIKPTIPQINLYQTDHELFCVANIPGLVDLDKLDVYVDYSTLELRGTIDIDNSFSIKIKEEILQGVFERRISLPFPVRSDKIKATYKNGLVFIQLHRLISETSRKNRVNVHVLEDN